MIPSVVKAVDSLRGFTAKLRILHNLATKSLKIGSGGYAKRCGDYIHFDCGGHSTAAESKFKIKTLQQ